MPLSVAAPSTAPSDPRPAVRRCRPAAAAPVPAPVAAARSGGPRRTALFVREFARHPLTTASLLPSSGALARAMVPGPAAGAPDPGAGRPVVVELGPGTGAFTAALQHPAGIRPDRHLALELNPVLGRSLAGDHPDVEVVVGAAADLLDVLADRNLLGRVDLVVSGLPWQAFAGPVGARLVPDIARALRPTGAYTQFTYSWTRWAPPGRRQLATMRAAFGSVTLTGPVWRNLPPATVYTCRRPAAAARAA
ncbi:class I SAM-dependent methyltransferase [Nakamurella leprariae]|uniref:SAM-dependent methyltransferase n=1 Tax=Nakamurella leprariae TaxID=2803911 RepID=A0A938YDK3_9ACTN|nr:hypothetical protein [Nakamurella leprariae]MBM9467616.1 hypothetical protein [Nakamurella leprariae]